MYTFKITEMGDGREGKQNDSELRYDNFILVIDKIIATRKTRNTRNISGMILCCKKKANQA